MANLEGEIWKRIKQNWEKYGESLIKVFGKDYSDNLDYKDYIQFELSLKNYKIRKEFLASKDCGEIARVLQTRKRLKELMNQR